MPSDALGRLRQLLSALYSRNTEREVTNAQSTLIERTLALPTVMQFLKYSTNLLLELTSRAPDYTKSPFDTPLSECKFEVRFTTCTVCLSVKFR